MLCDWLKTDSGYRCAKCGFATAVVMYRNCGPEVDPREALREMRRKAGIVEPVASETPASPPAQCQYLGDMLGDDDGAPARENVPCSRCGNQNGRMLFAVHECTAPDNAAGECIPYYRPTEKNAADYAAEGHRPRICRTCPRFASIPQS